jgi:cytochrome P450
MQQAPGPRGREVLAVVLGRKHEPVRLIAELHEKYGDTVRIPVGDTTQFVLGSLDGVKHVLVDQHRNYSKGPAYELLTSILGNGLITSEGEHWKKQRKLIQPIFQKARLRIFSEIMVDLVLEEVRALEALADSGRSVDVFSRMMDLALKIVSRTVLGTDVQEQERKIHDSFTIILHHIEKLSTSKVRFLELLPGGSRFRGLRKWLSKLPTDERKQFLRAIEALNSLIGGVISQRRAEMNRAKIVKSAVDCTAPDLVTMLLQTKDESGQLAMSDAEIRDEVMTLFLAGHETTATALTWTFYLLAKYPEYHGKIRTEIETVLQDRAPSLENLASLRMCQWVFEESMRLYPPVWRLSRFAWEKDEIQGYSVPKGSVIVVTPYLIHRDPRYWENPATFEPERFCPERASARQRLAYIPFGAGPRACVGAMFAMTEAQMILAVICRRIFFDLAPDHQLVLEPRVILRPQGGMPMSVHRVK